MKGPGSGVGGKQHKALQGGDWEGVYVLSSTLIMEGACRWWKGAESLAVLLVRFLSRQGWWWCCRV